MSARPEPLSKHLPPRLTRERLDRQWGAIDARVGRRAPRKVVVPLALAFTGLMAAAALLFFVRRPGPTAATLVDGTWLESAASGPSPSVTLAEGSRVSLGAQSRLRLTSIQPNAVRLDLARGRVDVQATHRDGRSFVVVAHDVEVHVVGTRFSVEADGPVRVRVEDGRVRVHDGDGERQVAGGEEWVAVDHARAPTEPRGQDIELPAADDLDATEAGTSPRPSAGHAASPSAKELLDEAQRATAQGRPRDAARLFDALRRDHPRDARAGLAAYELGRLRLDTLGDAAGAEEAFRDATRLARDAGLRDDAEARRVEALDRLGSRAACTKARDAYLARHAAGVHRTEVAARCGGT